MKSVLIFENHDIYREALTTMLGHEGFQEVHVARSREGARELSSQGVDLAVIGLDATDGNGVEVVRRLHEVCPDLPVLALTSDPDGARSVLEPGSPRELLLVADPLSNLAAAVSDLTHDAESTKPSSGTGPLDPSAGLLEEAAHHPNSTPGIEPDDGDLFLPSSPAPI